jgi:hypothetical protein
LRIPYPQPSSRTHGSRVFHYCAYLSGVFAQETYHDNEDFTQKTIFVLVSESSLFLMAPDIALIMVLMVPGASRRVQCSAIKDRERRSIGVYPVQPDGSRPRENVFTIYENKRICPKQSKFGVDEQSSQGCWISHRRTVALTWKHMPSYKTSRTMSH